MAEIQIITLSEQNELVDEVSQLFEIEEIQQEYMSKLKTIRDNFKTNQDIIQKALQNNGSIMSKLAKKDFANINNQKQVQDALVDMTRQYYNLRTALTGETIVFIENIDGKNRVIEQEDWLKNLDVSTSLNAIRLSESKVRKLGQLLKESNYFSEFTKSKEEIIDDVLNASDFPWNSDDRTVVGFKGDHVLYKKDFKDNLVYAFYSGKYHQKSLYYKGTTYYNLGWIYEILMLKLENLSEEPIDKQNAFIAGLEGEHPVESLLEGWTMNTTKGMKAGDYKTVKKQWIQSKRENEQVVSLLQVYETSNQTIKLLDQILIEFQNGNLKNKTLKEVSKEFQRLFTPDNETLNRNLLTKIRKNLMQLGQPII